MTRSKQPALPIEAPAQGADVPELRAEVARIFRLSLRLMLLGGLGVSLIAALSGDLKALAGAGVVTVVAPALMWALRRGWTRLAMTGGVSLLLAVACVEVSIADGIRDVGLCIFIGVALVSALLLDRRSSLLFSTLSVLSVAAIGIAEMTGLLHTRFSDSVVPGELAILVFLFGVFVVLIHTITRALFRGFADAALNQQTYREIFDATSDGIFIHDLETGRVVDVNQPACGLTGFTREELLITPLLDISRALAQSSGGASEDPSQRACRGAPRTFECKAARKDGSELWLDVAVRAATIRGRECMLVAVRDISDRKAAAEQLRAAEKLQAIGQLAGGIAHDFNNQLTGVLANATLLKDRLRADARALASIEIIIQCSRRSADLTRQLLAFARKGGKHEEVVDLDVLVREVATLLERSIDKRVTLALDLADDASARVLGDASLLQSALLNLGLNACDAMPGGGELRFETRRLRLAELPQSARVQLPEAERCYVRVRVSDTGVGIAPDALRRIFEPFFTTKAHGAGMGLSAAYGTAQAHGGVLVVTSTLEVGSTFELLLPATDQPLATDPKPRATPHIPRLRVLLAEDERSVGSATEALLRELGCTVTWCRNGREALDAFERDMEGFDLVILDHSMPCVRGSEVAERIAAVRPKLPIITTSGFDEGAGADACRHQRVFLPKPFDFDQLTVALDRALGRRPEASARARADR